MRRLRYALLGLLLVSLVLSADALAGTNGELDMILKKMQQAAGSIVTVHASFQEDRRFGAIGGGERYDGEVLFKHALSKRGVDKIRVKYIRGTTVEEDLWVNGNNAVFYQPQAKQAIETTTDKQASDHPEVGFIASPYTSVPRLKAQYDISYLRDETAGSARAAVLELNPKQKTRITKLIIWVDRGSWLPIKYQATQTNGDVLTWTLSNVRVGESIPESVFRPDLPKGTKVIHQ